MKEVLIFTDGSSHNSGEKKGLGGYGAVLIHAELPLTDEELKKEFADKKKILEIYGGSCDTTNQQMEIKAVTEALKRIKKHYSKYETIHVFTDSAYVQQCMDKGWYFTWMQNGWINSQGESVKNQDYWKELIDLMQKRKMIDVRFHKVKSHTGIFYNELADDLAKKGLKKAEKGEVF